MKPSTSRLNDLVDDLLHKGIYKLISKPFNKKTFPNLESLKFGVCNIDIDNDLDNKPINLETHKKEREYSRSLNTKMTDFVVKYFFQLEESTYNFLELVITTFEEVLEIYRKKKGLKENNVMFLHKGGNMLRFISKEFSKKIPNMANKELNKHFREFFKKSDADFAIHISHDILNRYEIQDELSQLSFLVIKELTTILYQNAGFYFNFFNYDYKYQEKILNNHLKEFNKLGVETYKKLSIIDFDTNDTIIEFEDTEKRNLLNSYYLKSKNNGPITVSYNDAIYWETFNNDVNVISHFSLMRSKLGFILENMEGKKRIVWGELIDVAIRYPEESIDNNLKKDINFYFQKYELEHEDKHLKFNSYNVKYLIRDLEWILFYNNFYPWDDQKSTKRLHRLLYLYFIDLFINLPDGNLRLSFIKNTMELIKLLYDNKIANDDIINKFNKFRLIYIRYDVEFLRFFELLFNLLKKGGYIDDLDDFFKVIYLDLNFFIETLNKIPIYCSNSGTIKNEDISSFDIKELI